MRYALGLTLLAGLGLAACESRGPAVQPQGQPATPETQALEAGAKVLQGEGPTDTFNVYLVGFHPLADDPTSVMEAHHYCNQVNEDFAQCVLFDGNTNAANLNGVEYIVSERLFRQLPAEEREHWHPHNYEILSGQLQAPGLTPAAELELMRTKMNSYGKTWHVWHTGPGNADDLPLGPSHLAWSFNADEELPQALIEERDRAMGLDTERDRERRQVLIDEARPQRGVNRLAPAFPQRRLPAYIVEAP